jgi:DNA-binding NarL/FixJ family response regulator
MHRKPHSQNGQMKIPVCLLVEDPLARERLAQLLHKCRSVWVPSHDDPDESLGRREPAVFVLPLYPAPAGPGRLLARVRSLRREFPLAKILLLGARLPADRLYCLLRQGVCGFLDGACIHAQLVPAIRSVWNGSLWLPIDILTKPSEPLSPSTRPTNSGSPVLTPQQARIAELARSGLANKQIAAELAISERTVKFHLQNIFLRLGIHGRHSIPPAPEPSGKAPLNNTLLHSTTTCAPPRVHTTGDLSAVKSRSQIRDSGPCSHPSHSNQTPTASPIGPPPGPAVLAEAGAVHFYSHSCPHGQ